MFYGPVLAVFVLAVIAPKVVGSSALAGLLAGICGNLILARMLPGLSWLWWNPAGFLLTLGTALALSRAWFQWPRLEWPVKETSLLLGTFVLLLALLAVF